jgi:biopolymer transport protein ExbD
VKLVHAAYVAVVVTAMSCVRGVDAPASAPTVVLPASEPAVARLSAVPMPPPAPTASAAVTTVDLPKAAEWVGMQVIFAVQVHANGDLFVDGAKIQSDAELLSLARQALGKNPELRAVIQADQAVTYGRVIHVLDVLKQGGVHKIAFGVSVIR